MAIIIIATTSTKLCQKINESYFPRNQTCMIAFLSKKRKKGIYTIYDLYYIDGYDIN